MCTAEAESEKPVMDLELSLVLQEELPFSIGFFGETSMTRGSLWHSDVQRVGAIFQQRRVPILSFMHVSAWQPLCCTTFQMTHCPTQSPGKF